MLQQNDVDFFADLMKIGVVVQKQVPLAEFTTFRLGGSCPFVLTCQNQRHLISAISFLVEHHIAFVLFGSGSNLVVSDDGVACCVVRYVNPHPDIVQNGLEVTVSASTLLDDLARFCSQTGLQGLNTMHGIPGTVGGAIVGNAGAFGKQVGDVLKSVELLTSKAELRTALNADLQFSYRHSNLKETGDIVVTATFALQSADPAQLLKEREDILKIRHDKHPDLSVYPCAGSFFRNIEPTSKAEKRQAAGWFLEQVGGKDLKVGGAKIFPKHANIIIKSENCTAKNVYELSQKMAQLVKTTYGFDLVREVRFVGKLPGVAESEKELIW